MSNICLHRNSKIIKIKDLDWSRNQNKYFSNIHGISSYLAMFCPAMPWYFINKYSQPGDLIMDNFSGRGTTALVAREKNRRFIGNDLNPYAFVLSKFKVSTINKTKLINFVQKLEVQYNNSKYKKLEINKNNSKHRELLYFYSKETYKQLLFIRDKIGINWKKCNNNELAVLAYALGLMHGPTKKNGKTIYFSLDMPNTISMAPNYVKKYAKNHKLVTPNVNIFQQIINRVNSKYDELLNKKYYGKILFADSTKEIKEIDNDSVNLVITSPPYLSIVDYTRSNWLKLWLLGYDRSEIKKIKLSDKLKFDDYCEFITNYLNAIYPKLRTNAKVCLIVGDVFNSKLIEEVWEKICKNVKYKKVEIYYDYKYLQTHKVTNMLNSRSGKATKVEKVLVLSKI